MEREHSQQKGGQEEVKDEDVKQLRRQRISCVERHDGGERQDVLMGSVRNMGNFNFSLTHVLTLFYHVEQCCYPTFLHTSHIPAMTSHVAYVIYATITLITTQGHCNITSFSLCLLFIYMLDRTFSYVSYLSFLPSHIHVALLTLCRSGIKSI